VSRIYWDSMLFIYWLEDNPQFAERIGAIRARMQERGDELITSAFTFGEILAGAYRQGARQLADRIGGLLESAVAEVIPFTGETADHYADIRGRLGIAPADAIHLACAAQANADLFLTNDKQLTGKFVPGIQFIVGIDTALF
jgi:predicted nucleic acid-binding protein